MKKFSFLFFVMFSFVLPNLVQAQDIVITEIMYNPPESGVDSLEFVELYNASASPINMDGYTFTQGVTYTFGNITINSGEYFVVAVDSVAIGIVFGTNADAQFGGGLSNGGEDIVLQNNMGVTVDSVNYLTGGTWPNGTGAGQVQGGGASLRLCDLASDNNDGSNWSASTEATGVIINSNEVLASPGAAAQGCPCINTTATLTETACDTYTVPSGDETYTTSGMYMDTIPNGAGCDSVLTINLTINSSTTSTDVITACDTYDWIDGNTYTSSNNTAMFTIANGNAAGCDSIVTLDLTINSSTTSTDVIAACDTYDWIDGNTYTSSNNTAMFTIANGNAAGCDSVVTLDLTINSSTSSTDVHAPGCGPFTWIDGNTYTLSNNTATFTIANGNAAGCDSVVMLDLTLNSSASTVAITACDTYTVPSGDETYTTSGMYMDTIPNGASCDSIITINLTINASSTSTEAITACDTYTVPSGDETYTTSGMYMDTIPNGVGCDSIITINLTINSSSTSTDVIVACDTYDWIDGNTYTSSNNTATFTIANGNAAGCDSIVTLDLTINSSTSSTDVQAPGCGPFTWIDGNTYALSNNTATFTYTNGNAAGCDSIVTLDLTLNSSASTVAITACDTYTVPSGDETYTTSGMYMDTIPNGVSCDSIITIDLTVNYASANSITLTECTSYTVPSGDETYTTSGMYMDTIPNGVGCDSVLTIDLTIILDVDPVLDSVSLVDILDECSIASITAPTASDVCSGSIVGVPDVTFPITAQGTTVVTWTFTDGAGNAVTQTQNVIITDVTPPTASNPAGITAQCIGDVPAPNPGFVIDEADNCTAPVVAFVSDVSDGQSCPETITRTFSVTDVAGLSINVVQTIVVNDIGVPLPDVNTLPTLSDLCSVTPTPPTATDNCSGILDGTADVTFPITALGTTIVTWTYTDDCGNQATQTQDVTIIGVDVTTSIASDGITIVSNNFFPGSGITYQWIDCTNDSTLVGETNHNFTPVYSSDFAVIITEDGCSDTSACVTVTEVGLEQLTLGSIELYPNPNAGTFTIEMIDFKGETPFKVVDILGKEVMNAVIKSETTVVELDVEPGVYYIVLPEGTQRVVVK